MRFVNKSGTVVSLPSLGIPATAPGEFVEIPDSLCKPGRTDNGSRRKSPIEMYAPQLEPADLAQCEAWLATPEPVKRAANSRMVTSENMRAQPSRSLPPGVQAAMLAKAAALAAPAPEAPPEPPGDAPSAEAAPPAAPAPVVPPALVKPAAPAPAKPKAK